MAKIKDSNEDKVIKVVIGCYKVLLWPVVLSHKMQAGKFTLRKRNQILDAHLKFKDSTIDEELVEDKEYKPEAIDLFSRKNYQLFIKVLIENFSPECLINLQRNIRGARINRELFYFLHYGIESSGHFVVYEENGQYWVEVENAKHLFHELFHLATYRRIDENLEFNGFEQVEKKDDGNTYFLGTAINEGYTELMAERYFKPKKEKDVAYQTQVDVVKKIELIVGKEKMETLYMTSNPKGLFEELSKYLTEQDVHRLLFLNDYVLIQKPKKDGEVTEETIKKYMELIDKLLINAFINKTTDRLNNHEINEEEYREAITEFLQSFEENREQNDHKYVIHSPAIDEAYRVLNNPMFKH